MLDGVGPERAKYLVQEFAAQKDYLDELISALTVLSSEASSGGNTVCFTGKMPEKRSYYERLASENGYVAVDAVSRDLSLLVAADIYASGGKLDKARKFNVKIISLDDFLAGIDKTEAQSGQGELFEKVTENTSVPEKSPFEDGLLFSFDD